MSTITIGNRVQVHFRGCLTDGTEFDSSYGDKPMEFIVGSKEVIPGFTSALIGMDVGDIKEVTIECKDAYGERRDDKVIEVHRKNFPADSKIQVGGIIKMQNPQNPKGNVINMRVIETKPESIVLDANHPLAGRDLQFKLEIISIAQ